MDQDKKLHRCRPLPMRLSMKSACPYIMGKIEQRIAVDINYKPALHDSLARAGFRRVENWIYKPACPNCEACVPWRVNVRKFQPSRNMARIIVANRDLVRRIIEPNPTSEHYRIFKSYVKHRHEDGQMARMNRLEFSNMTSNSPIETSLIDYQDQNQKLVGSVLTDLQQDGLSAVYSFFDPYETNRSMGTYMIIDLINYAKELNLPWLYLGYYVAQTQKMRYKSRFQPAEIYYQGSWKIFER